MKFTIIKFLTLLSFSCFSFERGTEDIKTLKQFKDDLFQIFCIDDHIEYLTSKDIENGRACNHIITRQYRANLIAQDIVESHKKLCDYLIVLKKSKINDFLFVDISQEKLCMNVTYQLNCKTINQSKLLCSNKKMIFSFLYDSTENKNFNFSFLNVFNKITQDKGDYVLHSSRE